MAASMVHNLSCTFKSRELISSLAIEVDVERAPVVFKTGHAGL